MPVTMSVATCYSDGLGLAWIIPIDSCGLLNDNCPHSMKCGQLIYQDFTIVKVSVRPTHLPDASAEGGLAGRIPRANR